MLSPEDYLLKEDRLIGHELVVERTGLCRRRVRLKDVYYNQLMSDLVKDPGDVSFSGLYLDLRIRGTLELVSSFSPKKGRTIGLTKTSRRINDFNNKYLNRADEILREKERKSRHP